MLTVGLLAQVLIAKYLDHLPLYRQERIFERAGFSIPRSTLAQWVGRCGVTLKAEMLARDILHADKTQVALLNPGAGTTQRAYQWAYCTGAFDSMKAVVYDFADSRAGKHARDFLGDWRGTLVCDDYAGYKALLTKGVLNRLPTQPASCCRIARSLNSSRADAIGLGLPPAYFNRAVICCVPAAHP